MTNETQNEFFEEESIRPIATVAEEVVSEDEIQGTQEMQEMQEMTQEEENDLKRKGRKKGKAPQTKMNRGESNSRYAISFNLENDLETYESFHEVLGRINNKNIGRDIAAEEVLAKLLKKVDHEFILELQKESLTEEEMNIIFRTHFSGAQTMLS